MRVQLKKGEELLIGLEDSEDEALIVSYRGTTFQVRALIAGNVTGKMGIIYKEKWQRPYPASLVDTGPIPRKGKVK